MISINDALLLLTDAIKESIEYCNYMAEKGKVKGYPELKAQIDKFRRHNFEMQTRREMDFDEMEQMRKEYAELLDNPIVGDFLGAELDFCRMMQDINLQISEIMDFDFEYYDFS
jgi:cell fate (sporulation/competence/biofilm development) regulator YlbF (YheA/YmcA/DUF963 family)